MATAPPSSFPTAFYFSCAWSIARFENACLVSVTVTVNCPVMNSAYMWGCKCHRVIISRGELIATVKKWKTSVQAPSMNVCTAGSCQPGYTEQTRLWWAASVGQGTRTSTSHEFSVKQCTSRPESWAQCWTRFTPRVLVCRFQCLL